MNNRGAVSHAVTRKHPLISIVLYVPTRGLFKLGVPFKTASNVILTPTKYRCPVELCNVQGMTYDEADRQLNWPVATVKNRLAKGRLRLRSRLAQRGLAPGAIAVGLATARTGEGRAVIPPKLVHTTVRAATARATGAFPEAVTHLSQRVSKTMMWENLKLVAVGTLAACGFGPTAQAVSRQAPNDRFLAARSPHTAARSAEKPGETTVRDRRWVRSLPSGATIDIIGVSSLQSGADSWWRPDGTPLNPAPIGPIDHKMRVPGCPGRRR